MSATHRTSLGVVGGLGPLASAEFLKTIYERNVPDFEQHAPRVLLLSDPSFPDRTEALLAGKPDELLARLSDSIRQLLDAGASEVVICCMTIHHLLPSLAPELRRRVVSLLDVIFEEVEASPRRKYLLLCSSGTHRLGLFQRHPRWGQVRDRVLLPSDDDQEWIHRDLIYVVKKNRDVREFIPRVASLLEKYGADSFIAGCSEMHLLAKQFGATHGGTAPYDCIDPLTTIADRLAEEPR